ncbi:MAG: hypothetical protein L0220_19760 [Acidobacteria bacterium]|nr:hypothetical protein [Acidobacteriota bacterium]
MNGICLKSTVLALIFSASALACEDAIEDAVEEARSGVIEEARSAHKTGCAVADLFNFSEAYFACLEEFYL